jgi:hypothetical protein
VAFSEAQKVSIRRYLGYPLGYYDLNYRLEAMFGKIGDIAVEQSAVEVILAELATVDAVVATGGQTVQSLGSLKKADEVEWHPITNESRGVTIDALKRGKMLIERLRQSFGVPLYGNYFGTSTTGDNGLAFG